LDWRDGQTSYLSHNGRRNEYQHLADGKVSSVSITDTLTLEYEFNDNGNIVGIRHNGYEQQYEYSAGQLSGANTLTGNYNYRYDVTGNRTVASATGSINDHESILDYNPVAKGNRLEKTIHKNTGEDIVYRYNEAGSPISIGDLRYHYNANQRPIKITRNGDVVAEYSYNSFGERIKKVTYSQNQKKVTYFLYDKRTLVAEIDGDTLEYRQNIYLKNTPVAHLIGKTTYAVHTDNLGTPKLLTNRNGDTVWEAAHTPLGEAVIEKQDIPFNLRFPGQYADAETGTHYNYKRDYDPRTGRYLTSDPVGLEGGDNTYAYASNDVLGAIDFLGLSSQVAGLPAVVIMGESSDAAFTLDNASNAVVIPSTLTPDVAKLGITDINQLVTDFTVSGSGCKSETSQDSFNFAVEDFIDSRQDHRLLVGGGVEDAIAELRYFYPATGEALAAALEFIEVDDDTSLLLIQACASDSDVQIIVKTELGNLVHQSEIDSLIAAMDPPNADGCRPAQIVNVTQLRAEVLARFQVKLGTDQRVVDAEKELILVQKRYDDFVRIHGDNPCSISQALCNEHNLLHLELFDAQERLVTVLAEVYDEQIENGDMPRHDVIAEAAEFRAKIIVTIIGIFIPLTPEDAALEAATAGFSRVARLFGGAADLFKTLLKGGRRGLNATTDIGGDIAARITGKKKAAYVDAYPGLQSLKYADIVRFEGKLGADGLRKLEADFVNTPGLADAFKNNPALADAWKTIDDIGACSFDGNTAVVTEFGLKPINQLQIGLDKVLARDERTGAQKFKNILAKYSNRYSEKVIIRSINENTNEHVSVVSNRIHPIFTLSREALSRVASEGHTYKGTQQNGEWVDAADLVVGDRLLNSDGSWSVVSSLEFVSEEFEAFNLTVQDFNTYFVGEQDKQSFYWVHNTCPRYLRVETLETIFKSQDKFGADNIKFVPNNTNNAERAGSLQITDLSGKKIGELHNGTVVPIYKNNDKLYEVTRALADSPVGSANPTAVRVGPVENGYQTVLYDGKHYIVRDADTSGISAADLNALTAHDTSHTIARHGPDLTDEQLLLRAQTGIAPDGSHLGTPPSMSTRFGSNEQMVIAKDDVLDHIAAGNYNDVNGVRTVIINSSDVYGDGIARGASAGTRPTDVTGVTARLQKDDNGVWQITTIHPGVI